MLTNWLSPVNSAFVSTYFNNTFSCQGNFPDLSSAKLVVFSREPNFSNAVRQALSKLHNHFDIQIVDIGNLTNPNTSSIYQVISELQDGFLLPILIGVDQISFKEICNAMHMEGKLNNAAYISNHVIFGDEKYSIENIGYQRHKIPKFQFEEINDSNTPGLSLGGIRSHNKILEPILRESNYIHLDLASIRRSDSPNKKNSLPTGLNAEEACQIMRYAGEGMRSRLISFDTSGLEEENEQEAMLVAELIWYLHEGFQVKPQEHPALSDNFKEYIIELNEVDHSLIFTQSQASGKWWLKIDNESNKYVSCAFEEYQQTIEHEIPDRLLKLM